MASSRGSRLRGFIEARQAFKRLPEVERNAILDVQEDTAAAIVYGAKVRLIGHRLSGQLARAVNYSVSRRSGVAKVGIEKGPVYWGHFLEFGTVKMGAHPFMRPAVEAEAGQQDNRLKGAAQKVERRMSATSGLL